MRRPHLTLPRGGRRGLTRGLGQTPPPPPTGMGEAPGLTVAALRKRAAGRPADAPTGRITVTDYGPDTTRCRELEPMPANGSDWPPAPDHAAVRWVHLDRAADAHALAAVAARFALPPMVLEDLVHLHQRSKLDRIEPERDHAPDLPGPVTAPPELLLMLRMVEHHGDHLHSEQVALLIGEGLIITVTEDPGDVWSGVRQRIERKTSRLRRRGADFLAYALIDAVVDALVPAIDLYDQRLEALEARVRSEPDAASICAVHDLRHEVTVLRREQRAAAEAITHLAGGDHTCVDDETRMFLRDVMDHHRRALDQIDTAHDAAGALGDAWANAVTLRDSEVMKLLTLVASIFIPLSFLAGVFGMNFTDMPLIHRPSGVWIFLGVCVAVSLGMVAWFRYRRWL